MKIVDVVTTVLVNKDGFTLHRIESEIEMANGESLRGVRHEIVRSGKTISELSGFTDQDAKYEFERRYGSA